METDRQREGLWRALRVKKSPYTTPVAINGSLAWRMPCTEEHP
jgi:hypothetical protein